ncbi:DUF2059 domain-containing protein [Rhizobium sp. TRM96647]|uniref:DUF2059 domain-containing protein n=1 Tax=unclassified Rhizobium TaxID=2613769 RepID=UPI001E56FF48|nr:MULTISPECIES: DUF2059 domain-containing protein [unclassified Rhizobium]MCD2184535.1 DUF2059 domain-containing protein [Rhizobium sp. GN54]MCV3737664.1 DUF2059 domain-containing protein [Rhizobium sp. TRM96647]MCV3759605.1 DUF2059 domain-containing protein [Rhizobium sp. TRM96650]
MTIFAGFGRTLAATLVASVAFAGSVMAQDATPEQVTAARAAMTALNATGQFDAILPQIAEQLKGTLIQSSPNFGDLINKTVDEEALALAPRRADLEREVANIYAKTFTVDELNAIAAFYGSEAGKKLLQSGPLAAREVMKAADIWAAGISRDLAVNSDKKLEAEIGAQKKAEGQQQPQ